MRVPSLETRVIHLVSADGFSRYITVSNTWQWLYLAWTFRNFSQLPETVLSGGQRHMLKRLRNNGCQQRVDSSYVIGTLELTDKDSQEMFARGQTPQPKAEAKPVKKPEAVPAPRAKRNVKKAAVAAPKPTPKPASAPRLRFHRGMAIAVCVLMLAGGLFGWQRLARAGYVPAATKIFTELTPAVSAAQVSTPEPSAQQPAIEPAQTQSPAAEPVAHPVETQPTQPAPQAMETPAAPATNPVQVAEVLPAQIAPATAPRPVKAPEKASISLPTPESLRQDARPKHLTYPPAGTRTGKVVLGVNVDSSGAVESVQVVSGDRALAKSAAETVKTWRYQPTDEQFKSVVTVTFMGDDAVMVRFPTPTEVAGMSGR